MLANGGDRIKLDVPMISKGISKITETQNNIFNNPCTSIDLIDMMISGKEYAKSRRIDNRSIVGSTFTSQKWDTENQRYSYTKFYTGFIGFIKGQEGYIYLDGNNSCYVPAKTPPFVLLVLVDEPNGNHYGGVVALPTFKEVAKKALTYFNK